MPNHCLEACWDAYDAASKIAFDQYQAALTNCNGNQACEATAAQAHADAQLRAAQAYAECVEGCA